jgi:hypothetical protein
MPTPTFITGAPQANSPNTIPNTFTAFYVVSTGKTCIRCFIDLYNNHSSDVVITLWITPPANQDQSIANKRYAKAFAPGETQQLGFNLLPAESRVFLHADVTGVASIRICAVEM